MARKENQVVLITGCSSGYSADGSGLSGYNDRRCDRSARRHND